MANRLINYNINYFFIIMQFIHNMVHCTNNKYHVMSSHFTIGAKIHIGDQRFIFIHNEHQGRQIHLTMLASFKQSRTDTHFYLINNYSMFIYFLTSIRISSIWLFISCSYTAYWSMCLCPIQLLSLMTWSDYKYCFLYSTSLLYTCHVYTWHLWVSFL